MLSPPLETGFNSHMDRDFDFEHQGSATPYTPPSPTVPVVWKFRSYGTLPRWTAVFVGCLIGIAVAVFRQEWALLVGVPIALFFAAWGWIYTVQVDADHISVITLFGSVDDRWKLTEFSRASSVGSTVVLERVKRKKPRTIEFSTDADADDVARVINDMLSGIERPKTTSVTDHIGEVVDNVVGSITTAVRDVTARF